MHMNSSMHMQSMQEYKGSLRCSPVLGAAIAVVRRERQARQWLWRLGDLHGGELLCAAAHVLGIPRLGEAIGVVEQERAAVHLQCTITLWL